MGSASSEGADGGAGAVKAVVVAILSLALVAAVLVAVVFDDDPCSPGGLNAPADGSVPQPSGAGPRLSVRVGTWNVRYFNSADRIAAGIRDIAGQADVIGLDEFGPAKKQRAVAKKLPKRLSVYTTPGNMTGIVWDKTTLDVVDRGVEHDIGFEHVEEGASGTAVGPRYVLWMTLRQRTTGAVFTTVNTHIVPTIDRAGHPDTSRPRRLALYRQQVAHVGRLTARFRAAGPVMVIGDWNIDAAADAKVKDPAWPYVAMQKFGLYSNWRALGYPPQGTHEGGRLIDYVWETANTVAFTGQRILPRHGSDHNPVAVGATNQPTRADAGAAAAGAGAAGSTAPAGTDQAALPGGSVPDTLVVPGPGGPMTLTKEQLGDAATIISEGKAHSIPSHGWVIALATALQESGIRMLKGGDRDSRNMFQQRPSVGWGTLEQLDDPHLATQAFYGVAKHTTNPGLVDVRGWRDMSVTQAAQAVQHSGFPGAYQKWVPAAEAIVKALGGVAAGSVASDPACVDDAGTSAANCPLGGSPAEKGLTADALLVLRCAAGTYPKIKTFYGLGGTLDHVDGKAVDIMLSSAFSDVHSPEASAYGWKIANWVRVNHRALGVHYVIFAAKIWNVDRDREGWRPYGSITGHDDDTSLHYDHVHVSVWGAKGTGFQSAAGAPGGPRFAAGKWAAPLANGGYRVGCGFGCYSGHTGQDFPAHSGTPVYATDAGVVVRSVALKANGRYVSYGNLVVIEAVGAADTTVYYAHLQQRLVTTGTTVRAGQQIGLSGYTGHVIPQGEGGAHLHYEIRVGGNPVDPLPILRKHGVTP